MGESAAPAATAPIELPGYMRLAYHPENPIALADLPTDFYAVQLLAMTSREELEAYADARGVPGMSATRVERDGTLYYVLLLGVYESRAKAEAALADLPPSLADLEPWVRNLGSLQAAMKRAELLEN